MSLLHPTVGEMIDRLGLVALKVQRGQAAGLDVSRFQAEKEELEAVIQARPSFKRLECPAGAHLMEQLMRLHEELWPLVERADKGDGLLPAADLHRLNRRRHECREELDRLAGEYQGPEKI